MKGNNGNDSSKIHKRSNSMAALEKLHMKLSQNQDEQTFNE